MSAPLDLAAALADLRAEANARKAAERAVWGATQEHYFDKVHAALDRTAAWLGGPVRTRRTRMERAEAHFQGRRDHLLMRAYALLELARQRHDAPDSCHSREDT